MNTKYIVILNVCFLFILSSCEQEWLDIKRDKDLIVPTSLGDLKLLLTNETSTSSDYLLSSLMCSDEYNITTERFNTLSIYEQRSYLWDKDIFLADEYVEDWDDSYHQVLIANVILQKIEDISTTSNSLNEWNSIKGGALFLRAKAHFNLAQSFAKPYNNANAEVDLGIPIRTDPDVNQKTERFTLKETYDQIVEDLEQAVELLPEVVEFKTDASKPAALGMLARCYLSMEDYENALKSSEACLNIYDVLLDYNVLTPYETYRFPRLNDEVIYHSQMGKQFALTIIHPVFANNVPEELFNSYSDNDLRKQLFFQTSADGGHIFKGTYEGSTVPFSGLASDELYLIKAESLARLGEWDEALNTLNALLETRFISGTFVPFQASSPDEALNIILTERRKELLRRGLRWADLRRLNKDPERAITLQRTINEVIYELPPNDSRYVMPIPDYVIDASGIDQNPR